jgi:hypothetical protein
MTHHDPKSRKATTFPHIVFFVFARNTYIPMALFPETLKEEFRTIPVWTLGTLRVHNSLFRPPIGMKSKANL